MKLVSQKEKHIGTLIEIKLLEKNSTFFSLCFKELERIEETYSRFKSSSKLSFMNAHLGTWHHVSDEFLYLLKVSEEIKKKSMGAFDITIKSTLDNLGYDKEYSFKEKIQKQTLAQKLKSLLPSIQTDEKNKKVLLRKEIDLGGIGKGYALDQLGRLLDAHNVSTYYINAGGDILVKGITSGWEILLEHPDDSSKVIGKVLLKDMAIAGSSSNRRRWGKHHHLINAKSKKPEHSVKAIFVIHKQAIYADAYATAVFTTGFEEGILLSQHLDLSVLIISATNKMYCSPGFDVEWYT